MLKCKICGKEIEKSCYGNATLCSSACFNENYWLEIAESLEKDPKARVIENGTSYYFDRNNPINENKYGFKGFDGHVFKIRYNDGEEITTNNLWHNGKIPEKWKTRIKDNAIIVQ